MLGASSPLTRRAIVAALGLVAASSIIPPGHTASAPTVKSATPSVVIDDTTSTGPVNRTLFGVNDSIWDRTQNVNPATRTPWPSVAAAGSTLGLHFVRMDPAVNLQYCTGVDCTYHWMAATPGAPGVDTHVRAFQLSPDEWMQQVQSIAGADAAPMIETNIEAGTISEAQDWVAYMNGDAASALAMLDGSTVGRWAQLRIANGHAAPYGVHFWEIGNEENSLHPCPTTKNGAGCVNTTPPDCLTFVGQALYGCLIKDYGTALKAVDSTVAVVASFDGTDFTQVHATSGGLVDVIDAHQYPDAQADPYGTTFDTDGQRADYPISFTTSAAGQQITYGLWMSAVSPAHVDVYLDHAAPPLASVAVQPGPTSVLHPVVADESTAGTHTHTLSVVACDPASVSSTTHLCTAAGRHATAYLQHLTVTTSGVSSGNAMGNQTGCFSGVQGLQSPNGGNTTLVDTRVATSTGASGGAGNPGTPWRLASNTDFPIAYASGSSQVFGGGTAGQMSKLAWWRHLLSGSGFTNTPLIVGEYAAWGGCSELPVDLSVSQASAIASALVTETLYADSSATQPIIGASAYTFQGGAGPMCFSWHMVTTVLTSSDQCQGSDTAYLSPVGLVMSQFAGLSGSRVKATVSGGPALMSFPAGGQPFTWASGVTAVASASGTAVDVVLVNACPAQSQCGTGSIPVQLRLASGKTVTASSATTVSQSAYADNIDAAPTTVGKTPLSTSNSGGSVALTLPPFSVTTVTISTS